MIKITRTAVEVLAQEHNKTVLVMLTELQSAAAELKDEETVETLCQIKAEILEL